MIPVRLLNVFKLFNMFKIKCRRLACIFMLLVTNTLCAAPLFEGLGNLQFAIETRSPMAQRYFNQGLALFYSFEYGESIRSFKAAFAEDPKCAMCAWGVGLALSAKNGSVMNGREREEASNATKVATKLVNPDNKKEVNYIFALQQRRSSKVYKKRHHFAFYCGGKGSVSLNETYNYANEMRKLVKAYPEDVNAKALFAAALFDVLDWNLWGLDGKPQVTTVELINVLEQALEQDKEHIGANHYYIHALEKSPYPEKALESAQRLAKTAPGIEQLAHAPAHLYYALGRYAEATVANQKAIEARDQYAKDCQTQGVKPETNFLYYHNLHSLVASSSMEGNSILAIQSAQTLTDNILQSRANLQGFIPVYILTLARFGEWQTILNTPNANPQFQYALGLWYYAQGLACVHTDNLPLAVEYLRGIKEIAAEGGIPKNLGQEGIYQLQIAAEVLAGVLADKKQENDEMIKHFQAAVAIQDKMINKEPAPWYFSTRELLGMGLLKTKKTEEAKSVFEEELKRHPHNPWALHGLVLCLTEMGDVAAAKQYQEQLQAVWHPNERLPMYLVSVE